MKITLQELNSTIKPPSYAQVFFARKISNELGIDLPKDYNAISYKFFISDNIKKYEECLYIPDEDDLFDSCVNDIWTENY